MNKLISGNVIFKSVITSVLYFLSSSVLAGGSTPPPIPIGTITYGQQIAAPVPTLSGMMLIVLALLLAAIAFRILRQKENHAGRMMILSLLAIGTLASGLSGVKLINDAYASIPIPTPEAVLTDPNGSEVNIGNPGLTKVINETGGITTILGLETIVECGFGSTTGEQCEVGLELANTEFCFVFVDCFFGNPD